MEKLYKIKPLEIDLSIPSESVAWSKRIDTVFGLGTYIFGTSRVGFFVLWNRNPANFEHSSKVFNTVDECAEFIRKNYESRLLKALEFMGHVGPALIQQ